MSIQNDIKQTFGSPIDTDKMNLALKTSNARVLACYATNPPSLDVYLGEGLVQIDNSVIDTRDVVTSSIVTQNTNGRLKINLDELITTIIDDVILLYGYIDNGELAFGYYSEDNGDFTSGDISTYPSGKWIAEITTTSGMTQITDSMISDKRVGGQVVPESFSQPAIQSARFYSIGQEIGTLNFEIQRLYKYNTSILGMGYKAFSTSGDRFNILEVPNNNLCAQYQGGNMSYHFMHGNYIYNWEAYDQFKIINWSTKKLVYSSSATDIGQGQGAGYGNKYSIIGDFDGGRLAVGTEGLAPTVRDFGTYLIVGSVLTDMKRNTDKTILAYKPNISSRYNGFRVITDSFTVTEFSDGNDTPMDRKIDCDDTHVYEYSAEYGIVKRLISNMSIVAQNNKKFSTGTAIAVKVFDNKVFVASSSRFMVFSTSNLTLLSTFAISDWTVKDFYFDSNYLYIASDYGIMKIVLSDYSVAQATEPAFVTLTSHTPANASSAPTLTSVTPVILSSVSYTGATKNTDIFTTPDRYVQVSKIYNFS